MSTNNTSSESADIFEGIYNQVVEMSPEQLDEIQYHFQLMAHAIEEGTSRPQLSPEERINQSSVFRIWCEAAMIVAFERRAQVEYEDERIAREMIW
jgi:hypothetical protein